MSVSEQNRSIQPLVSIVVVTWNNEADIAQALKSCISSAFKDHEVIVVCNKSTDQTLAEVRSVCDLHGSLFRVIENEQNVGLGEARNQGIKAAKGEYVAFLDGDDWFSADALPTLGRHLSATRPDVLYFNFVRAHPDGQIEANSRPKLLLEGWRETAMARATLMGSFGVAWNRAYRRVFLGQYDLSFPLGLYEDVCWNLKVLALAERIYVVPDVLVMYRQRAGSILRSRGKQHHEALAANRRIIAFLSERPEFMSDFGLPAFRYTQRQLINTFIRRIPWDSRSGFLSDANSLLKDFESLLGFSRRSTEGKMLALPIGAQLIHFALVARRKQIQIKRKTKKQVRRLLARFA